MKHFNNVDGRMGESRPLKVDEWWKW